MPPVFNRLPPRSDAKSSAYPFGFSTLDWPDWTLLSQTGVAFVYLPAQAFAPGSSLSGRARPQRSLNYASGPYDGCGRSLTSASA